jgi:hypothetical protein
VAALSGRFTSSIYAIDIAQTAISQRLFHEHPSHSQGAEIGSCEDRVLLAWYEPCPRP